jgi:hypothetical protein
MPLIKINKKLDFNKDGFHASHSVESSLSISEIFPDRPKGSKEDCIQLTVVTKDIFNDKEERSAYIRLDNNQIKDLYKLFGEILKVNEKNKKNG